MYIYIYIRNSIALSWKNKYTSGCSSFTSLRTFTFSYHPDVPIYPDGYLPIYCTITKNNIAYHNDLWKEKQVCGTNWCTETKHDPSSALQPLCTSSGSETSRQQVTLWHVFCTSLSSCPILIDYITIRTLIIDILQHDQKLSHLVQRSFKLKFCLKAQAKHPCLPSRPLVHLMHIDTIANHLPHASLWCGSWWSEAWSLTRSAHAFQLQVLDTSCLPVDHAEQKKVKQIKGVWKLAASSSTQRLNIMLRKGNVSNEWSFFWWFSCQGPKNI